MKHVAVPACFHDLTKKKTQRSFHLRWVLRGRFWRALSWRAVLRFTVSTIESLSSFCRARRDPHPGKFRAIHGFFGVIA